MSRPVALAGTGFLIAFAVAAVLTGQRNLWFGNLAQLVPPLAFAAISVLVARQCAGQVRVFWNLNAIHAVTWATGQAVWTYSDIAGGGVPIVSPSDPVFFMSSIPLAAALYGRPDRDRPRWLFDIVLLDIVLIALFAAFLYLYFIVALAMTGGPEETYHANLTQLFNARNLLLAGWAAWVWHTASSPQWRRVLGIYCLALAATFAFGVAHDFVDGAGWYQGGSLWDLGWMVPYVMLSYAAAQANDHRLLTPVDPAPALARLPVVSLIAITMLVLIPVTAEAGRYLLDVPPAADAVRTRLALTMMIPFGVVVVIREFLSRRVLLRAGQELVQTREQLAQKEKLAAVGQLVSGVAHELNNPLQGVLGYAELMAQSPGGARQSEELRAIQDNANRAAGIVRNLLTFTGRETPARRWLQVNGIVHDTLAERASLLELAGIDVRTRFAERLPLTYLDSTRFQQVLLHLVENAEAAIRARQAASTSPETRRATRGEIQIETRRESNPDRIVVEVADNGVGVRAEDLTRLFEPFFTTKPGEGQGLGLSICYGVVREHGGFIHAHNRENGGTSFVIELPVTAESSSDDAIGSRAAAEPRVARQPESREPSAAGRPTPKPKALVVDDEDSNAALVRRALELAGYDVESTTLSRRALIMIERTPYDVVVADVKMPELSGQELYARACQIRPELSRRFIFVTGDIDGEETLSFLEQSRCGYFMKPFNLERLTTAVDMLVGGQRDEVPG
jgi:signal transduction histidine kinase/ActR/RegA family two-component response regulator